MIERSVVNRIAKLLTRSDEGILTVSRDLISQINETSKIYDFNINHIPKHQKIIRFMADTKKRVYIGNEFENNSKNEIHKQVSQKTLSELLLNGDISNALYLPGQKAILADVKIESCVILAGSFNPLHHGHRQLLSSAIKTAGHELMGVYELSISNCSKNTIHDHEIFDRSLQFEDAGAPLLITNRPYFRDKVEFIDKNSWFCIGADTYRRFFDAKYYDGVEQLMDFTQFLIKNDVRLVVGPRLSTNKVDTVQDYLAMVPESYRLSVREIENFRVDISSTQIRNSRILV